MKRQPTEEQKARAEERRQKLRELWQKIGEMSDEQRVQFAERVGTVVTCEGHPLTMNNSILLAYQADNVTVVGGFQQWKKVGRQVCKGQRALGIWIPKNADKEGEQEQRPAAIGEKPIYFIFGSVFDISQTEPIQPGENRND